MPEATPHAANRSHHVEPRISGAELTARMIELVKREIVSTRVGWVEPAIDASTSLVADLHCDVIDRVVISHEIEEAFDVRLPADGLDQAETIADLVALVEREGAGA